MIGTALVAVIAGIRLIGGDMAFVDAMAVLLLAPELYLPLRAMGSEYHAAAEARATLDAAHEACEVPASIPSGRPGASAADPRREAVRLDDIVIMTADAGRRILDGVTLTLEPGTVTALVGPSGAGKSTILRLILALQGEDAGLVTCGDRPVAAMDPDQWRGRIAWIPQAPMVLPATLAENLRIARPDAQDAELWSALAVARLDRWAARLPHGLDTGLGDGAVAISAGERRRLALVRAVLRDAALVLADEPTANLDAVTAEQVRDALAELVRGRTALIVTHEPDVLVLADRTVELRDGRLSAFAGAEVAA